ncbi:hypothetical protein [Burkholderia cenocepacia]|uniref:hypothetical protein n=1 Tax=Burkholderia cenocepacia TaxID=95486 RepID=UPI002874603E|nr:hypothetical protein [Burkholderia cenocepacia]MDS0850426.1 hypothetical protein [Burkholderia cenocepacia]
MTTGNENSPLTQNASGQEIRTAFEAQGLSSADNGTPAENLSQGKSPALERASEATAERPSMEVPTAERIVSVRTGYGNGTDSKVSGADTLTDALIRKIATQYCEYDAEGRTYNILRYECEEDLFNCIRELLAPIPASRSRAPR